MLNMQFHGRQQLAGWQQVASVGNQWNQLATGGINWQHVEAMQMHGKLYKIRVKPHRTSIMELIKL